MVNLRTNKEYIAATHNVSPNVSLINTTRNLKNLAPVIRLFVTNCQCVLCYQLTQRPVMEEKSTDLEANTAHSDVTHTHGPLICKSNCWALSLDRHVETAYQKT
jgi:hypothetical protein